MLAIQLSSLRRLDLPTKDLAGIFLFMALDNKVDYR
jgi:hypothetical protein